MHSLLASTVPLALVGGLLTGCGGGQTASPSASPTAPSTPAPTATPPIEWASCVSREGVLRVDYPDTWTARDHPDGGCAYFDPQAFAVERSTEAPIVAVRLDVESVPYERVLSGYLDSQVLSQRSTRVAGYRAVRIEDRNTDGPLRPKGLRVTYLADLGEDRTLVFTTSEADAMNFPRAQEVLDLMADRLERAN